MCYNAKEDDQEE